MAPDRPVLPEALTSSSGASASSSLDQRGPCGASSAFGGPAPQGASGDVQASALGSLCPSGDRFDLLEHRAKLRAAFTDTVNEVIEVRRSYNHVLNNLFSLKPHRLDHGGTRGAIGSPKAMDEGIPLRAHFVNVINKPKKFFVNVGSIAGTTIEQGSGPSDKCVL